jgi:hypothetical protein
MAAVPCYSSARFAAYTPSDVSSTTYYYRVKKTETNEVPEEKKTTEPKSAPHDGRGQEIRFGTVNRLALDPAGRRASLSRWRQRADLARSVGRPDSDGATTRLGRYGQGIVHTRVTPRRFVHPPISVRGVGRRTRGWLYTVVVAAASEPKPDRPAHVGTRAEMVRSRRDGSHACAIDLTLGQKKHSQGRQLTIVHAGT